MRHFKFPKWSRKLYPEAIWDFSFKKGRSIYLTFDDGPEPGVTNFVLDLLDEYNAQATFFCLGERVRSNPDLFQEIKRRGHVVGNHGMHHINGLRTTNEKYWNDVLEASKSIDSNLFRPAYGKIKSSQYKMINEAGFNVVFWTAMAYDFDTDLDSNKRINKMKALTENGAIFVFHDNKKSLSVLKNDLPQLMEWWRINEFTFKTVSVG